MAQMAVLLALFAALTFGASDFLGGMASRRGDAYMAALVTEIIALIVAVFTAVVAGAQIPESWAPVGWGVVAGVGSAVGIIALYSGFASGQMSVVAPLSAVLTVAVPAVVGFVLGERLGGLTVAGIVLAIPAVLLVSMTGGGRVRSAGVVEGLVAGMGFALWLVALDRAGSHFGTWPLACSDSAAAAVIGLALALPGNRDRVVRGASRAALLLVIAAGIIGGGGTVMYVYASGLGELSVVAVLTSLYPASTVLLARFVLHEEWHRTQIAGLVAAAVAVAMISV